MKRSISNIAWPKDKDLLMYEYLKDQAFEGIEIAPTRIFPESPYDHLEDARRFTLFLKNKYNLSIASMQSIWYGRSERIFHSQSERIALLEYTKKAILFAEAIECENLVFGCPKNRVVSTSEDWSIALEFFKEIGDFALEHNTVLAMEPNPTIYHTNFINSTEEAFHLVKEVACPAFKVNIDVGTIIYNGEELTPIITNIRYINHIHISEPGLGILQERNIHKNLYEVLVENDYKRYVSIEVGLQEDLRIIEKMVEYVKDIFQPQEQE